MRAMFPPYTLMHSETHTSPLKRCHINTQKHQTFTLCRSATLCNFLLKWVPVKTSSQRKYTHQTIHRRSWAKFSSQQNQFSCWSSIHAFVHMLVTQLCKTQLQCYSCILGLFWKNDTQAWDPTCRQTLGETVQYAWTAATAVKNQRSQCVKVRHGNKRSAEPLSATLRWLKE